MLVVLKQEEKAAYILTEAKITHESHGLLCRFFSSKKRKMPTY
jgi:hypothetical protein